MQRTHYRMHASCFQTPLLAVRLAGRFAVRCCRVPAADFARWSLALYRRAAFLHTRGSSHHLHQCGASMRHPVRHTHVACAETQGLVLLSSDQVRHHNFGVRPLSLKTKTSQSTSIKIGAYAPICFSCSAADFFHRFR